jgi:adenosylcobinamide amidohydrolase
MIGGWPALSDDNRLLVVRLGGAHRTLSWAVCNGGFARASAVVWRYVSNDELSPDVDPARLLSRSLTEAGLEGAVGLLTARDLTAFDCVTRQAESLSARSVATVGLSNAVSAGDPPGALAPVGTINVLLQLSTPLSDNALVELLALATEARTAAVLEAQLPSGRSAKLATGTGTDCIVVAAPDAGGVGAPHAGKHTLLGALAGGAVGEAVARGVRRWVAEKIARSVQSPSTIAPNSRSPVKTSIAMQESLAAAARARVGRG